MVKSGSIVSVVSMQAVGSEAKLKANYEFLG